MKAYMFSFDALLGFLVSLAIIYTLLIVIMVPYGYYNEFEQAYVVARDTGLMMYHAEWDTNETYVEELANEIVSQPAFPDMCNNINDNSLNNIIPPQYAYTVEYYNTSTKEWKELCSSNATYDSSISCAHFRKFRVYAPILVADYIGEDYNPGDMPYCYISCKGYEGNDTYAGDHNCTYTPCEPYTDMASRPGIFTGVVRIGVCV